MCYKFYTISYMNIITKRKLSMVLLTNLLVHKYVPPPPFEVYTYFFHITARG